MKNMQNFYQKLGSFNEKSLPHQKRLALLTRLNRVELLKATSSLTWDIWGAAAVAVGS